MSKIYNGSQIPPPPPNFRQLITNLEFSHQNWEQNVIFPLGMVQINGKKTPLEKSLELFAYIT